MLRACFFFVRGHYLGVGATSRRQILHDNVADTASALLVAISLEVCKCRIKKAAWVDHFWPLRRLHPYCQYASCWRNCYYRV